jgi:long-subunit fatty acid transport protein
MKVALAGWAYDHQLIDLYELPLLLLLQGNHVARTAQEAFINRTGGQSALDFSFGANYSNKLYLGLGLSFTDISYNSFSTFSEDGSLSVLENNAPATRAYSSDFTQDQVTRGNGFSARLGLIYKPVETVRLGATFTSPTFYNIDDAYSEGLYTRIANGSNYNDGSGTYTLNYNLRTPLKVAGGAAVFIKQFGFITGDIEYLDYSSTHLSANVDYNSNSDNAAY